jgi:hypothetical protein
MGATVGHLWVLDLNVSKMDWSAARTSIDFVVCSPKARADAEFSIEALLKERSWDPVDVIVRVVWIPLVEQPAGYVLQDIHGRVGAIRAFTLEYPSGPGAHVGMLAAMPDSHPRPESKIAITLDGDARIFSLSEFGVIDKPPYL